MNCPAEEQDKLLGFLNLYETANKDGYLGAMLITDLQGIPQEFRCTYPVKPTSVQKSLYGDTLVPYIGVHLCGIPLIKTVKSLPSLIIVPQVYLLEVRPGIDFPVVLVQRAGDVIEVETPIDKKPIIERERLECPTKKFQPIIFAPHPHFYDDRAVSREILGQIFGYLDPLEPFERMSKALHILSKQDQRFL